MHTRGFGIIHRLVGKTVQPLRDVHTQETILAVAITRNWTHTIDLTQVPHVVPIVSRFPDASSSISVLMVFLIDMFRT